MPFGGAHSITGTLTQEHRLPGEWYQLEAGLHYNWHRHYDASIGRYTQPDPLGFVDGPSQYAYARSGPQMFVDPDGRVALCFAGPVPCAAAIAVQAARMCFAVAVASTMHSSSRPDACGKNNSCMAGDGDDDTQSSPPSGSKPIDQTDWSGNHGEIKDSIGSGGKDKTRIDPEGNVWGENPDGTWTNHGPAANHTSSGRPEGRRGSDRRSNQPRRPRR
jgi:RHS repeat-associated protein